MSYRREHDKISRIVVFHRLNVSCNEKLAIRRKIKIQYKSDNVTPFPEITLTTTRTFQRVPTLSGPSLLVSLLLLNNTIYSRNSSVISELVTFYMHIQLA